MTKRSLILPWLFSLLSFHLVAGPFTFTTLDFPGSTSTNALGVNTSGQVVGSYQAGGVTQGFLLSGGVFTSIDFSGSSLTSANGINDSGQVVGDYISGGVYHGFLLNGGVFTTLDFPSSTATLAEGINASGQVVGEYNDNGGVTHGFLATPTASLTPEPGTLVSTVSALSLIAAWNWRRRRRSSSPTPKPF